MEWQCCPTCGYVEFRKLTPRRNKMTIGYSYRLLRVLEALMDGHTDEEIAKMEGCSTAVIKNLLHRTFRRWKIDNRVQLAVYFNCELFRIGLIELKELTLTDLTAIYRDEDTNATT